ncbi:hypothetical protein EHV15_36005 [Paenibacillus oralis]|uniref:Uncharacterized protein n=1 Tax=Paenibacillus oralis TaxID=2490856 RepID=A0A3P3TA96_9BACL|nr:hypothetical protein [Paenibacillus oralis]RRJ54975.1 hypothetical protein EHV15_36005 [Paenibacillus oralis]
MDSMDRAQERNDAIEETRRARELGGDDKKGKVVKSFKVRPETRDWIDKLFAASGIQVQDEWLEKVVQDWEMRELAKGNPDFTYLLDKLDYFLGGISNIFLAFLHGEQAEKRQMEDRYSADADKLQEELEKAREDLSKQLEENKEMSLFVERIQKEKEQQDATIEQLRGLVDKSDLLVKEYTVKNQNLSDLVSKQTKAAEEGEKHAEEARAIRTQNEQLTRQLKELEDRMTRMEEKHREELASSLAKKDLEHEKEKVQLQAEYQDKLESMRNEMTQWLMEALKPGRIEE